MIIIDGSQGEGGGQILRTALGLSMVTGLPFRIEKIRAGRRKPGLLRQHLTCVKASVAISGAKVSGAELGSTQLTFSPGPIRAGAYTFEIGSAGSTTLVFQTILPALLRAEAESRVELTGGTHNPMSPPFDYLERVFCPLLAKMGARIALRLEQPGFVPAGGGRWTAVVPSAPVLMPLTVDDAGAVVARRVIAHVANLPFDIAAREAQTAVKLLAWPPECAEARAVDAEGQGNVVMIEVAQEAVTEIFTGFGQRSLSAEAVAGQAVEEARAYLLAKVPVGPHLADQLLVPMALAGGGAFVTSRPTEHTRTNIAVIETFLPVAFEVVQIDAIRWRIAVTP